jgi:hypothetical protein
MKPGFHPRRSRRVASAGASLILGALLASLPAGRARSDGPAPATKTAPSWPNAERTTPEDLARVLRAAGAEKPAIFYVGFGVLFKQAHIPGSRYPGPGSSQAGLDALRNAVSALPKTEPIVLYCGCCPWERCPNIKPAWEMLQSAGFTRVKVLYIPKNFGRDWVEKGYPVEAGDPGRG